MAKPKVFLFAWVFLLLLLKKYPKSLCKAWFYLSNSLEILVLAEILREFFN